SSLAPTICVPGLGNGVTLTLFAGIVAELPSTIAATLELGRQGVLSNGMTLALLSFAVALTALVVVAERARRRVLVGSSQGGQPQWHLQFKLNSAGVMPTVLASWILFLPMALLSSSNWWSGQLGRPL